jgi:hypothetical protein
LNPKTWTDVAGIGGTVIVNFREVRHLPVFPKAKKTIHAKYAKYRQERQEDWLGVLGALGGTWRTWRETDVFDGSGLCA